MPQMGEEKQCNEWSLAKGKRNIVEFVLTRRLESRMVTPIDFAKSKVLFVGVFRRGNKPPVLPGENKKASAKEKPL